MDDEKLIFAVQSQTFIYEKSDKILHHRDLIMVVWVNTGKEIGADGIFLHDNINYQQQIDGSFCLSVCLSS